MSRAVRITVGAVLVGVLAFVALVTGIMSASAGLGGDLLGLSTDGVDTPATAEVLDVDDFDDWVTLDVRWTTPDGEVVVTYVDYEWGVEPPGVGDDVEVLYDDLDPEYAFAADDPWLRGGGSGAPAADEEQGPTARVAGWVALAALLGVVVGTVVTVVAAVRAPAPVPVPHVAGIYEAPHPHRDPAYGAAHPGVQVQAYAGHPPQQQPPLPPRPEQQWSHPG